MRESKAELTDRLRSEGRFEAFKKRREELKAGGMPAADAWGVVAAEFPPADAQRPNGAAPAVDLRALKGKRAVSVVEAATWAFEYLDAGWIKPTDAPSLGAWSLRAWARSSMRARSEFYKMFASKIVMPPQEKAQQAEEEDEAHDRELRERLFGHLEPDPEADRQVQECMDKIPGRE